MAVTCQSVFLTAHSNELRGSRLSLRLSFNPHDAHTPIWEKIPLDRIVLRMFTYQSKILIRIIRLTIEGLSGLMALIHEHSQHNSVERNFFPYWSVNHLLSVPSAAECWIFVLILQIINEGWINDYRKDDHSQLSWT